MDMLRFEWDPNKNEITKGSMAYLSRLQRRSSTTNMLSCSMILIIRLTRNDS